MTALVPIPATRTAGADNRATALVNATAADTFPAGDTMFLRVRNTKAGTLTVTVTPAAGGGPRGTTVAPQALGPVVEATTGDRTFGPFPTNPYADANGNVNVSYSPAPSAGDVTVGVYNYGSS